MRDEVMRTKEDVAAQLAALWHDAFKGGEYPIRRGCIINNRLRITDYRDPPKSYVVTVEETFPRCHDCLHDLDRHGEHGCTDMVEITRQMILPCPCPNDQKGVRTIPLVEKPPMGERR